jgi:hypothetical protein
MGISVGRRMVSRRGLAALAGTVALLWVLVGRAGAEDPDCPRWRAAFAAMPVRMMTLESGERKIAVRVKVAATSEHAAAGFQCATPSEIQHTLILFDFGYETLTQFHMQNVPAPLDIAFAKADGRIFSILRMEPSPTALYGPLGPFRYALEARAGFFTTLGIKQGAARLVPAAE